MGDEIKVNSENTLRKNLATLGQVKDALGKRDKKIASLKEDLVYGFNDNASYKEHTVDDSLKAIGTPSPLVNSCITISEVLRTFLSKQLNYM